MEESLVKGDMVERVFIYRETNFSEFKRILQFKQKRGGLLNLYITQSFNISQKQCVYSDTKDIDINEFKITKI